eukprot:gene12105-16202_t
MESKSEAIDQSIALEDQIREEIAASQPLIGQEEHVEKLLSGYINAALPGFVPGIHYLNSKYKGMRKVRGDGNCFYRALLYGYLENLLKLNGTDNESNKISADSERNRFLNLIRDSLQELISIGYDEFAIECFYDEMVQLIEDLFSLSIDSLYQLFQEDGKSNYYTWFMRLLTAGFMKRDPDRFLPFVEGSFVDIDSFCKSEVEPMNKECEQLQIVAITEYLGVLVDVEYLDGRTFTASEGLAKVVFLPSSFTNEKHKSDHEQFKVHLLYRPGHYDILYK